MPLTPRKMSEELFVKKKWWCTFHLITKQTFCKDALSPKFSASDFPQCHNTNFYLFQYFISNCLRGSTDDVILLHYIAVSCPVPLSTGSGITE